MKNLVIIITVTLLSQASYAQMSPDTFEEESRRQQKEVADSMRRLRLEQMKQEKELEIRKRKLKVRRKNEATNP